MSRLITLSWLFVLSLPLLFTPRVSAQFNPGPNPITGTVTTAQTISTGTGTINPGGTLMISGSAVAITVTGSSSILNNGTVNQTGTGRGVRDNTGGLTLTLTNGSSTNSSALIQTADADAFQMAKSNSNVTCDNYGSLISLNASAGGAQAIDWNAITTGSNTLNNHTTGIITASEADAVRPGVNGFVYNDGLIKSTTTTGSSSDGIDAQTNTGITIVNANTNLSTSPNLIEGGRHGITGGNTTGTGAYTMSITNNSNGTIQGDNGAGVNIDGINGNEIVTIVNHGFITGNGHDIGDGTAHDGDGVDVDGVINLTNTGTIKSINSFGIGGTEASEGVTVGGGTIVNSGTIQGSVASGNTTAIGRGITIAGVDKDANGNSIPVQAPYAAATITNSGLIKGDSDSAIIFSSALAGGFNNTITNQAGGVIEGGGAIAAAIQTGADNDTINNSGTIEADNSGKAIDMGAGHNVLNVTGGSASIIGDVSGGTGGTNVMTVNPGSGNSFSYAGSISNFSSVGMQSGTVTLSGANTYTGVTAVSGAILRLDNSGGNTARLTNTSGIVINSGATLALAGTASSSDRINNSAAITINSGGAFNTGGFNEGPGGGAAGAAAALGTLSLTNNATIDFTSGTGSNLLFASLTYTPGDAVTIANWTGTLLSDNGSATNDRLLFISSTGLADAQLAAFQFFDDAGQAVGSGATQIAFNGYYEVLPVPEPGTWSLLSAGLLAFGSILRRQRIGTR